MPLQVHLPQVEIEIFENAPLPKGTLEKTRQVMLIQVLLTIFEDLDSWLAVKMTLLVKFKKECSPNLSLDALPLQVRLPPVKIEIFKNGPLPQGTFKKKNRYC